MDIACLFAWGGASMMLFRFVQGIGTGGEVPVASAYINEYIGSKGRGRFFLLYEVMFLLGLCSPASSAPWCPLYGWQAMFLVGLVPAVLLLPLRFFMKEWPRWLASKGRYRGGRQDRHQLEPAPSRRATRSRARSSERSTQGHREVRLARAVPGHLPQANLDDLGDVVLLYLVANGMITWLPTLYRQVFNLPLETSLLYGLSPRPSASSPPSSARS